MEKHSMTVIRMSILWSSSWVIYLVMIFKLHSPVGSPVVPVTSPVPVTKVTSHEYFGIYRIFIK